MGLEMNTDIVENLGKPGNLFHYLHLPMLPMYYYMMIFPCSPPNQCCRSSGTFGKVGRNTEKPQTSDWRNMRPIYI